MDQQTWIMALWIIERHGTDAPQVAEEIVERLRREHADESQITPWPAIHDAAVEWLREALAALTWFTESYRLRRLVLVRFGFALLSIAFSMARCCCWTAETAALVHQPAIVLAQVNKTLRGVAFMCPRGDLQMSERPSASLTPHQPCSSASAH